MTVHDVTPPTPDEIPKPLFRQPVSASETGLMVMLDPNNYRTVEPIPAEGGQVYPVARPKRFQLEYRRDGATRVVVDLTTGIWGAGSDVNSAMRDFRAAANQHLDVLERQGRLSEELVAQRDYLRERIPRHRA